MARPERPDFIIIGATLDPQTEGTRCFTCDTLLRKDGVCDYCTAHLAALNIQRGVKALYTKGQIVEVRALLKQGGVLSGYFNNRGALAQAIYDLEFEGTCSSIYTTLNPIDPAKAAVTNKIGTAAKTTRDADITSRRWLLIDFDPARASGTSSTDEELKAAGDLQHRVHGFLRELGWPEPVHGFSGNGYHLLYPLAYLPNTAEVTDAVNGVLRFLSKRFTDSRVTLDTAVGNAARICKAYGTTARKGNDSAERPWRGSYLQRIPEHNIGLLLKELQDLAAKLPAPPRRAKPRMAEGFDLDQFTDWFDLDVTATEVKNDVEYHYLAECPIAGRRHSGDPRKSALVVSEDGPLGYSCFSDECAGRGIGEVLRTLGGKYKPYPYPLFASVEVGGSGEDAEWDEPIEEVAEETPLVQETVTLQPKSFLDEDDILDGDLIPCAAPHYVQQKDKSPIPIPRAALYGWLADVAGSLQAPMGWAYPAVLTVFAAMGVNMNQPTWATRPSLYTCLLGKVNDGKSRTMDRAEMTLIGLDKDRIRRTSPGSDTGLLKMFAKPAPKKGDPPPVDDGEIKSYLLLQDEFKTMLSKIGIQNSSLAPVLCTLWYRDQAGNAVGAGVSDATLRLNILGALKCDDEEEFTKLFAIGSTGGLYDRFVFGVGQSGWKWDRAWRPREDYRQPIPVEMSDEAATLIDAWKGAEVEDEDGNMKPVHHGRVGEIAERIALISASANREGKVSEACMRAAIFFAEWQEEVRRVYVPGDSESRDGDCTASILRRVERERDADGKPKWFKWNRVYKSTSWNKTFGPDLVRRMRAGLVEMGTLDEEKTEPEPGDEKKRKPEGGKPTGRYRLKE